MNINMSYKITFVVVHQCGFMIVCYSGIADKYKPTICFPVIRSFPSIQIPIVLVQVGIKFFLSLAKIFCLIYLLLILPLSAALSACSQSNLCKRQCLSFPFSPYNPSVSHHGLHQFISVTQSCPSLCDPVDCRTPGFPVHHQLSELAQTHVHWVGDAIQPSHPLSSSSPPAVFPSIRVFPNEPVHSGMQAASLKHLIIWSLPLATALISCTLSPSPHIHAAVVLLSLFAHTSLCLIFSVWLSLPQALSVSPCFISSMCPALSSPPSWTKHVAFFYGVLASCFTLLHFFQAYYKAQSMKDTQ